MMPFVVLGLFTLFGGTVYIVVTWYQDAMHVQRAAQVDYLIRFEGGASMSTVDIWGAFGPMWVKPLAGAALSVHFHSTGGRHPRYSTRYVFRKLRSPTLPRCEIYTATIMSEMAKLLGMQDIEVGSKAFDDAFILKAPSESWMRNFATPEVRKLLLDFAHLHTAPILLSSYGDTVEFRVDEWLDGAALLTHVRTADRLVCLLVPDAPTEAPPLEIWEGQKLPVAAACLVCGESLASRPVMECARCDTPHHLECWKYNGSCAVYGCAGVAPRVSPRVAVH